MKYLICCLINNKFDKILFFILYNYYYINEYLLEL
jgi:hypothetical protein